MTEKFKLRNHDSRTHVFPGGYSDPALSDFKGLCIAGSGCPTPPDAAKQIVDGHPFSLPPLFEMTEVQMFKSYRAVVATMRQMTRMGKPAVEVFVDGVPTPLTAENLNDWAADYRSRNGIPEPKTHAEHVRDHERALDRPEDPIERQRRLEKAEDQGAMVQTIVSTLRQLGITPPVGAPVPIAPAMGRNDEPSETPPPQRARPRP